MLSPFLQQAHADCEAITHERAGNFFYDIRLLPPDRRAALCAVYARARRIDDIGDGDLPVDEKRRRMAEVRASIDAVPQERPRLGGFLA